MGSVVVWTCCVLTEWAVIGACPQSLNAVHDLSIVVRFPPIGDSRETWRDVRSIIATDERERDVQAADFIGDQKTKLTTHVDIE